MLRCPSRVLALPGAIPRRDTYRLVSPRVILAAPYRLVILAVILLRMICV